MIELYRILTEKTTAAKNNFEESLKVLYPAIESINIYSPRNIMISTANHQCDIYSSYARLKYNIQLSCNTSNTEIPTDEQAIAHVKHLRQDRADIEHILDEIFIWFADKNGKESQRIEETKIEEAKERQIAVEKAKQQMAVEKAEQQMAEEEK